MARSTPAVPTVVLGGERRSRPAFAREPSACGPLDRALDAARAEANQHLPIDLDGRHAASRVEAAMPATRARIAVDVVLQVADTPLREVGARLGAVAAPGGVVDHHLDLIARAFQL